MNDLAHYYQLNCQFEKSIKLYQEALEVKEKILGSKHIDIAICVKNIGALYEEVEKPSEAFALYKNAVEILM